MKEKKSSMKPFVLCSVLLSINEKDRGYSFILEIHFYMKELFELIHQQGTTLFVATHDPILEGCEQTRVLSLDTLKG